MSSSSSSINNSVLAPKPHGKSEIIKKSIDDRLREEIMKEKCYNNIIKKMIFEKLEKMLERYLDMQFHVVCKYIRQGKKGFISFSNEGIYAAAEFDCEKLLKWGRPYDLIKEWILEYLKEIPSMTLVEAESEKKKRHPIMKIILDEFYVKEMELAIEKEMLSQT